MKTEAEVRDLIDHLEESLHDHHLFLNEQYVIDTVLQSTDFMIRILKWVVEDPQFIEKDEDENDC